MNHLFKKSKSEFHFKTLNDENKILQNFISSHGIRDNEFNSIFQHGWK